MEAERSELGQSKAAGLGQPPAKAFMGSRGEQSQGGSRPGEQGNGSRPRVVGSNEGHGYFEEASYPDFEVEDFGHLASNFESHYSGHHPDDLHRSFGHLEVYDGGHLGHEGMKGEGGMKDDLKDLSLLNPLLYKPASKPPIIREGDWLCPDPTCCNVNWAKRVYCNRCGRQRPHLSKIKNRSYMLSKLSEENTWSCNVCKNINKTERKNCYVCGGLRSQEPEEEFKPVVGTQRAEITYDELKKQNEENADNEELIQNYISMAQEQRRKLEHVRVMQKASEKEFERMEEERRGFRGGGGRGGKSGGGRGGFGGGGNFKGKPLNKLGKGGKPLKGGPKGGGRGGRFDGGYNDFGMMRPRGGYGGGFNFNGGDMMGYGPQGKEFNQWGNPREYHQAEEDFRKMKEAAFMRGPNPPNTMFPNIKRERSRSGEKENIRQNY